MIASFLTHLNQLDDLLWSYLAIPLIIAIGLYLTFKARFSQVIKFQRVVKDFVCASKMENTNQGIHPIKAFFASIGGCVGIANVVAVCTAVKIGGPGAIFWMWIAALLGMIVKYSEVYLGISYRRPNSLGGYDGGPMYYLQKITKSRFLPVLFAVLLCVYGTEVYMFDVMVHSLSENFQINHLVISVLLLSLIIYVSSGGIERVGKVSSIIIPLFLVIFSIMTFYILAQHIKELPGFFKLIINSAFKGHAALGGFTGSGIMLAISQGVARSCYSGDIGVGYAAIVHSESRIKQPEKQAQMTILGVFLDTFIVCTFSCFLILVTGVWHQDIPASMMVQTALSMYFPYMRYFMPIFIFILGFSSLIAFFFVGLKCSKFIFPKFGKRIYYMYSTLMFAIFSFLDQSSALSIMSITGAFLLSINLFAIHKLRKEIRFF